MDNTTNNIVPLWLKIKPEYIDENFEGVLEYLQNGNQADSFYQATLDLLKERVEEYMESLEKRPAYYSESDSCDKSKLILEARLLIVYLIIEKEHNCINRKRIFIALLNTLSMLTDSELYEDILSLMVDNVINETEPVLTFKWDDLTDFNPTILIHKIINGNVFPNPKCTETCFESKGCVIVRDNAVSIVASNNDTFNIKKTQLVGSMDILDGKMNVLTAKREKLKGDDND